MACINRNIKLGSQAGMGRVKQLVHIANLLRNLLQAVVPIWMTASTMIVIDSPQLAVIKVSLICLNY